MKIDLHTRAYTMSNLFRMHLALHLFIIIGFRIVFSICDLSPNRVCCWYVSKESLRYTSAPSSDSSQLRFRYGIASVSFPTHAHAYTQIHIVPHFDVFCAAASVNVIYHSFSVSRFSFSDICQMFVLCAISLCHFPLHSIFH